MHKHETRAGPAEFSDDDSEFGNNFHHTSLLKYTINAGFSLFTNAIFRRKHFLVIIHTMVYLTPLQCFNVTNSIYFGNVMLREVAGNEKWALVTNLCGSRFPNTK